MKNSNTIKYIHITTLYIFYDSTSLSFYIFILIQFLYYLNIFFYKITYNLLVQQIFRVALLHDSNR